MIDNTPQNENKPTNDPELYQLTQKRMKLIQHELRLLILFCLALTFGLTIFISIFHIYQLQATDSDSPLSYVLLGVNAVLAVILFIILLFAFKFNRRKLDKTSQKVTLVIVGIISGLVLFGCDFLLDQIASMFGAYTDPLWLIVPGVLLLILAGICLFAAIRDNKVRKEMNQQIADKGYPVQEDNSTKN